MVTMKREKLKVRSGFYLRMKNVRGYFREAGYSYCDGVETKPYCQITMYIDQAHCFKTSKSAKAMSRLLKEKYGKSTSVFKFEGSV